MRAGLHHACLLYTRTCLCTKPVYVLGTPLRTRQYALQTAYIILEHVQSLDSNRAYIDSCWTARVVGPSAYIFPTQVPPSFFKVTTPPRSATAPPSSNSAVYLGADGTPSLNRLDVSLLALLPSANDIGDLHSFLRGSSSSAKTGDVSGEDFQVSRERLRESNFAIRNPRVQGVGSAPTSLYNFNVERSYSTPSLHDSHSLSQNRPMLSSPLSQVSMQTRALSPSSLQTPTRSQSTDPEVTPTRSMRRSRSAGMLQFGKNFVRGRSASAQAQTSSSSTADGDRSRRLKMTRRKGKKGEGRVFDRQAEDSSRPTSRSSTAGLSRSSGTDVCSPSELSDEAWPSQQLRARSRGGTLSPLNMKGSDPFAPISLNEAESLFRRKDATLSDVSLGSASDSRRGAFGLPRGTSPMALMRSPTSLSLESVHRESSDSGRRVPATETGQPYTPSAKSVSATEATPTKGKARMSRDLMPANSLLFGIDQEQVLSKSPEKTSSSEHDAALSPVDFASSSSTAGAVQPLHVSGSKLDAAAVETLLTLSQDTTSSLQSLDFMIDDELVQMQQSSTAGVSVDTEVHGLPSSSPNLGSDVEHMGEALGDFAQPPQAAVSNILSVPSGDALSSGEFSDSITDTAPTTAPTMASSGCPLDVPLFEPRKLATESESAPDLQSVESTQFAANVTPASPGRFAQQCGTRQSLRPAPNTKDTNPFAAAGSDMFRATAQDVSVTNIEDIFQHILSSPIQDESVATLQINPVIHHTAERSNEPSEPSLETFEAHAKPNSAADAPMLTTLRPDKKNGATTTANQSSRRSDMLGDYVLNEPDGKAKFALAEAPTFDDPRLNLTASTYPESTVPRDLATTQPRPSEMQTKLEKMAAQQANLRGDIASSRAEIYELRRKLHAFRAEVQGEVLRGDVNPMPENGQTGDRRQRLRQSLKSADELDQRLTVMLSRHADNAAHQ